MSDSAAVCPRCGERLLPESGESANAEASAQKKFDGLTYQEKNALREEFYRAYPAFRIPERKRKKLSKLITIGWWVCGGLAVSIGLALVLYNLFWWAIGVIIGILVVAIAIPILIGIFYTDRILNWQSRTALKKFNSWLEEEKNIVGESVSFTNSEIKAKYDAIDPDEEVKKWRS